MAWLSARQIEEMGFADVAAGVLLSERASFYNCGKIRLGARSRIDDFCVIAAGEGGITIGENVHIAVACTLIGQGSISLEDFSGLSSRVAIYSSSDDYSGASLTNPTLPAEFRNVESGPVRLARHVIVGAGSVILPGVTLEEGVAVGALSCIRLSCAAFGVYWGNPARRIGERSRQLIEVEKSYRAQLERT